MNNSGKKVKAAIVDNSIDTSVYNPIEHWSAYLDVEWDSFRATKSHFPDLKKGYTHLILTGSEASILERERWVYEEVEIVKEAMERGLSILGSCYGHQLLALALVGPSYVRRCIQPEVGWIPVQIEIKNELLGEKKRFYSFSVHFDEVVNLNDDFLILASSKECPVQAFQFKNKPIWGLQIHPEIDILNAQKLLNKFISMNDTISSRFAEALKSEPRDSGFIHKIVKSFFEMQGQALEMSIQDNK